jgi:pyruvate kinase
MMNYRKTKIIATLGPASDTIGQIEALARNGVNVFRLNFSHGSHTDHQARYHAIRAVEKKLGMPLAVLQDLQGPKIRIGVFLNGCETLVADTFFTLDLFDEPGTAMRVALPHPEVLAALCVGNILLIDDGKLRLKVLASNGLSVRTLVEVGGVISNRKGLNLPQTRLRQSVLTQKDRNDLAFGLALGVDWVAQSFVQHANDVRELSELVKGRAGVVAKLEKPLAIEHLDAIVAVSDAVMVARGDLGVEVPPEQVPVLQRRIVRACRKAGKPVIVATQMLESMITAPVPTRAETSDVATAVYDGVDAVMLSAESASGEYPQEAVEMMDRIIRSVESDPTQQTTIRAILPLADSNAEDAADAMGAAINSIASIVPLSATLTYTTSGASALRIARERPRSLIVGLTPAITTARKLALVWGVQPRVSPDARNVEEMVNFAVTAARDMSLCIPNQPIAIVAGMPFGTPGSTNLLRLVWPDNAAIPNLEKKNKFVRDAVFASESPE